MFPFLYSLALILSYAFIGGGIKLLDHLTDETPPSRQYRLFLWLLTISVVIVVNIWTILDVYTAVLALALVFGLLGARKVDNIYFVTTAVITLYVALFDIFRAGIFFSLLPPLLALIPAVILDEILHSVALRIPQFSLRWVLTHRPLVKIVVLIIPFFGFLTFIHSIGFWCFDITYDLVAYHFRARNILNQ